MSVFYLRFAIIKQIATRKCNIKMRYINDERNHFLTFSCFVVKETVSPIHLFNRNLASGNNERFAELIYSTIPGLTKHLESKGSEPLNLRPAMATTIINIISTICFGKRFVSLCTFSKVISTLWRSAYNPRQK